MGRAGAHQHGSARVAPGDNDCMGLTCGTGGKPAGNCENQHDPVAVRETGLLDLSCMIIAGEQVIDLVLPAQGPERQRQRL